MTDFLVYTIMVNPELLEGIHQHAEERIRQDIEDREDMLDYIGTPL